MSALLTSKGWISVVSPNKWLFIGGAALGCWTLLIAYAKFAGVIARRARRLNFFLSGLFMLLAILQMFQLYY